MNRRHREGGILSTVETMQEEIVMKRNRITYLASAFCLTALLAVLTGCSGQSDSKESEPEKNEPCYPVTVNNTEIRVGETKVQTLLDLGYEITWSEMDAYNQITEHVVEPDMLLESNSYYTGASIWLTEHTFAHISFVTDEEEVTLGDATVARLEFYFNYDQDRDLLNHITFNGVAIPELTREKAGEMFPDFTGDEVMWFSSGLLDYKYFMTFDMEDGFMDQLEVEREYDVDWNS